MLQRYFRSAEGRRLKEMLSPEMVRRSLHAYQVGLDIQDRVNEYTLFQGTLVRRQAQVFRGATSKVSAVMALFAQLARTSVAVAGAFGVLVYLHQHRRIEVEGWLGSQLSGSLARMPRLDGPIWVALTLSYVYLLWLIIKVRRRLREREAGSHDRVAAV